MTRALLGPGDFDFDEAPNLCTECNAEEDWDAELCSHLVCAECACSDCLADADIAEREAEDDRRERHEAMREDKGDEMREEGRL